MELFEQIRREYTHGVGTIKGVAQKFGVHRRVSNDACPATLLFPPQQRKIFHETILQEILQERVSSSRNRVNPRGVKRKMSNYNLRPRQRGRTRRINFSARVRLVK